MRLVNLRRTSCATKNDLIGQVQFPRDSRGREIGLPVERLGMDAPVGDDAVAHADRVVQAGQCLAPLGRLDPEAEPADLDRLLVEVHAVRGVESPKSWVESRRGALVICHCSSACRESGVF